MCEIGQWKPHTASKMPAGSQHMALMIRTAATTVCETASVKITTISEHVSAPFPCFAERIKQYVSAPYLATSAHN